MALPGTTLDPAATLLGLPVWSLLLALGGLVVLGLVLVFVKVVRALRRRRRIRHGPGSAAAARLRRAGFTVEEFAAARALPVVIDGQAVTREVVADLRLSRQDQRWVAVVGDAASPAVLHRALACAKAFADHRVLIIAATRPKMIEVRFPGD